ncbi:MAG: potassium channel family protein [Armatimonadaceae bacterium]
MEDLIAERRALLEQLDDWLETPMLVRGVVWLVLLVVELVWGLSPLLEGLGTIIWGVFILDFLLKITLAPDKGAYLKTNWITLLALLVPALRVLRVARVARLLRLTRTVRGLRLFRVVSSLNRSMRTLRATMERRGFGYVAALTAVITFAGAAGIYAFEPDLPGNDGSNGGMANYGQALWWTAMLMTTLGSEYWPQTAEGRILCFLLSLYAFAAFGYVTATLSTFFIGRDAENRDAELAGAEAVETLRSELAAMTRQMEALRAEIRSASGEGAGKSPPPQPPNDLFP